jgi:hypothetical protein
MSWIENVDTNQRPVIGVLSQSLEDYMIDDPRFEGFNSYIMSAYVKYIESEGA